MTSYKICATTGCPTIVEAGDIHCLPHRRARDKARGTPTQRGYDASHRKLRKQWEPHVQAGHVNCWRCRKPIHADDSWDLGHDDKNREAYRGPEHSLCNTRAAGHKSQR